MARFTHGERRHSPDALRFAAIDGVALGHVAVDAATEGDAVVVQGAPGVRTARVGSTWVRRLPVVHGPARRPTDRPAHANRPAHSRGHPLLGPYRSPDFLGCGMSPRDRPKNHRGIRKQRASVLGGKKMGRHVSFSDTLTVWPAI